LPIFDSFKKSTEENNSKTPLDDEEIFTLTRKI